MLKLGTRSADNKGTTARNQVIKTEDQPLEQEEATASADRAPLGQLLVEGEYLTQAQLDEALHEGSRTGERIGEVVVRRGLVTEDDVARLLADQWGLEYVERSSIWFEPEALALMSREDAQQLEALPTRIESGHVVVAVAEPTEHRLAALRDVIGDDTVVVVVPKSALDAGLRSQLLASRGDAPEGAKEPVDDEPAAETETGSEAEHEEPEPQQAPRLTAVSASQDSNGLSAEDNADAVVALAAEARAVAERLATQAAAVRAQAHEQNDLRRQAEEYEARISALEDELTDRQQRLEVARTDLQGLLERLG